MTHVLIRDFCLYGNSSEKMNISQVTAFWAPHTVGGRPACGMDTRPGRCVRFVAPPRFPDPWLPTGNWIQGGKVKKMSENPGPGGSNPGEVNNLYYQSEGFPLTGYFVPACVGRWAWPGQKNCRRVAAVGVTSLSARLSKEKLYKMMFSCRIQGIAMIQ